MTVRIVGIVDLVQYIYVTLDAKKKQGGRDFFLYGHEGQRENNLFVRDYASTTDSARIAKTSPHDQSDLWRGFFNISYTWEVCGIQAIEKKLPKSRFQEKPGYVTERRVVAWKEALKHSNLKIHRVARPSVDRFCFDSAGSDVFFPGCERKRQYERARTQEVVYGKLVTRIDSQYLYHSSVLSRAHVHK